MKDILHLIIGLAFLVLVMIGYGYIAIYLGMKLPYQLWSNGDWGFAIAQAIIVWRWLLGGKRK
ncbi:hypothetical protein [Enterococcus phage Bp29]|uniref:Uncharacterized protein n=1 Tax=Enterococcus phage vB_EfaS-DELF1 TaxID=2683673 RepID=A0A5S9MPE1_9CAUD|nr:hypothetical protein [Enterococcus phage Bp29]BBQ04334.1 hypothetical protein [Enterococcus phage vB_EfaS-DELF1]